MLYPSLLIVEYQRIDLVLHWRVLLGLVDVVLLEELERGKSEGVF